MTKFYMTRKTGLSGFVSFRTRSQKRLNMKIWRSKSVWSMKKGRRDINEPTLYISQVGPCRHIFQVMHVFLEQFCWISLKEQRSASNYKKMNPNWRFEASMMKPSSRRSKWIYGTHDLELRRGNYDILKTAKPEVPVWETEGSGFHRSDLNLSQDFHCIWLGFSDSWKGLCSANYIYVGHGRL
jgi:hypothetical protein